MTQTIKKAFLDIETEETWLNEQGANGMLLLAYRNGEYEFEDASPAQYQYKIEVPSSLSGHRRKDYFEFLEQAGITVVADYAGRAYLRKKADGEPFVIHSDPHGLEMQVKRKTSHFFSIGFSQIAIAAFLTVSALSSGGLSSTALIIEAVSALALAVSGIAFVSYGAKARKRAAASLPSKDEQGIWEP